MGRFAKRKPADLEEAATSALAGVRLHVDVDVPGTEVVGKMRVLTRSESLTVKAEALDLFKERGLIAENGAVAHVARDDWNCELAARHLAVAVRQADDLDMPLAPLEDWRDELSDEQLSGPWDRYQDLRDRLDPLGDASKPLTPEEIAIMRDASKKKDVTVLRSFGLHKLALFAITSADRPAT
jgi:hypothetical protein